MARYKLTITDTSTGKVMQEKESDTFVYHMFGADADGDPSVGSGCVHSGPQFELIGVLSEGIKYHKRELAEIFDLLTSGGDE